MPIFASEPATTVRQRSPWLLPLPAYGAVFLAIAFAAYGWTFFSAQPPKADTPIPAIAKVCIHQPNFAFQQAWQAILTQAKREVRENLQIEVQRSGQQTVAAISLNGLPAEAIVPIVNAVAAAYSQACRVQWKLEVEQACSAAQEKVRHAERQAVDAQKSFESLSDRRLKALASLKPAAPQRPMTIENPSWTEISQRLANLEDRRKDLLRQRTPQHPSVQEIEMQIADARRQMDSIPPKITQESTATAPASALPADTPTAMEVEEGRRLVERLNQDVQQAQAAERSAFIGRNEELRVDLLAAEPIPPPPAPRRASVAILGKALATATTSIFGLGMIFLGASLEPTISTIAELQALLPAPIVGVVPATHPSRRSASSALRRRLARWGRMAAGVALLGATAWIFLCG